MSMLGRIIGAGGITTAPLDNPVVLNNSGLGDFNNTSVATLTTSTVAPTSGGAILIVFRTRHTSTKTHNTPTTTSLTNIGSITNVADFEQANSSGTPVWHVSAWKAKFSGAAGTGTVTCTTSTATAAQHISVIDLGAYTTSGITQQAAATGAAAENVAGTSISATLGTTPKADSVVIEIGTAGGAASSHTQETGYTKLTDANGDSLMEWMTAYRNTGAAAAASMSVTSGKVRMMIVVEIAHQN